MRRIVIKEGPIVFLRNVVVMEIIAAAFLASLSYVANYEELYNYYSVTKIVSFNNFLILSFSAFQLVYILLLFIDWYYRYYEIREKEVVRRSGIVFRRQKSVSLANVVSVEISQSPIDRLTRHATLILEHTNGRTTKMKNISGFEEHVLYLKQMINNTERRSVGVKNAKNLVQEEESQFLEFKQSLRFDVRKKVVSKDVEKAVMKTIAGFMNADGGTLVIGVDDDKKVVGLANDYETLAKKNRDGFENHLSNLVKSMIGVKFANYVKLVFDHHDSQEVCIVLVDPSHKPAYVTNGAGEEFYVRIGNSTQPFSMSDAEEYIKTRWR